MTAHASSTLSVARLGAVHGRRPTASRRNSGDAVKTFVDANIQITRRTATNRVGDDAHLHGAREREQRHRRFVNAPDGTQISFTKDSGPGTLRRAEPVHRRRAAPAAARSTSTRRSPASPSCRRHTTLSVGGVALTRHTDGAGANSGPATKTWVDAKISIAPNATNEVGQPHTFTVTLQKDTGTGSFVPAAGEHVDFTLTRLERRDAARSTPRRAPATTPARTRTRPASARSSFTSPTPGKVTGARVLDAVGRTARRRSPSQTDGTARQLRRRGQDVRRREHPDHAADGDEPDRRAAHVHGARQREQRQRRRLRERAGRHADQLHDRRRPRRAFTTANPCTTVGAAPASCTVTLNSAITGVDDRLGAHDRLGRRPLARRGTRTASGANSGPATKTWVNAKITIAPDATNQVGQSHTFMVTLSKDTGTGSFVPAAGEHVDVTLTDSHGATHTAPTGDVHSTRRREHRRERPVHDHVHLEHDRQGDRARVLDALGQRLGAVHGADRPRRC